MNLAARKRYPPEFKAQAVDLLSTGKPVAQVAEEFCISSNLLYNWRHNSQGANSVRRGVRRGLPDAMPPDELWAGPVHG